MSPSPVKHCGRAVVLTTKNQLLTTVTQTFGVISILHGLGNHVQVVTEAGELRNYLFFTWITVFFFNLAIPTGKIAVVAFLIEMNAQGSKFFFPFPFQEAIPRKIAKFYSNLICVTQTRRSAAV